MTEPQTVTTDHLRDLLAQEDDASLVLEGGQVHVRTDAGPADGALEVATAADLRARLGTDPDEGALVSEATALTSAVQGLGG